MAMIYSLGPASGAHLNPAVTIGFSLRGAADTELYPCPDLWRDRGGLAVARAIRPSPRRGRDRTGPRDRRRFRHGTRADDPLDHGHPKHRFTISHDRIRCRARRRRNDCTLRLILATGQWRIHESGALDWPRAGERANGEFLDLCCWATARCGSRRAFRPPRAGNAKARRGKGRRGRGSRELAYGVAEAAGWRVGVARQPTEAIAVLALAMLQFRADRPGIRSLLERRHQ